MAIVRIENNLTEDAPFTYLLSGESQYATSLRVKNISQFTASQAVQVGETGNELSEIRLITTSTPSGTSLAITAGLSNSHPTDTVVYQVGYDKAIIKRCATGTTGIASAIATVSITPDADYTQYDDTAGTTGASYKVQYYNSVTANTSNDSDWIELTGYKFYSLSKLRERVKNRLNDAGYIKSDDVVDQWLNDWYEMLHSTAVNVNKDYSIGTVDVALGTSGLGTITSSDFKELRRVWMTTDGSNFFKAQQKESIDYYPNETFSESYPFFYYQGDNIIGKLPQTSGTARISYYKNFTPLENETDELPVHMRGYTSSFVDYATGQAFYLDNKDTKGDRFLNSANAKLNIFRDQITPRHHTGVEYIENVEEITADSDFWW